MRAIRAVRRMRNNRRMRSIVVAVASPLSLPLPWNKRTIAGMSHVSSSRSITRTMSNKNHLSFMQALRCRCAQNRTINSDVKYTKNRASTVIKLASAWNIVCAALISMSIAIHKAFKQVIASETRSKKGFCTTRRGKLVKGSSGKGMANCSMTDLRTIPAATSGLSFENTRDAGNSPAASSKTCDFLGTDGIPMSDTRDADKSGISSKNDLVALLESGRGVAMASRLPDNTGWCSSIAPGMFISHLELSNGSNSFSSSSSFRSKASWFATSWERKLRNTSAATAFGWPLH
mmetsp:Transcript_5783/g.10358  ORF Transcript_5783/g.10358 Transcript_5783/m.10358 type:complete len:290 (-) Transcript_5783:35-904(-)